MGTSAMVQYIRCLEVHVAWRCKCSVQMCLHTACASTCVGLCVVTLVTAYIILTFTTSAAPFHCSIRDRSGCLGKHPWRPPAARIAQGVADSDLVVALP